MFVGENCGRNGDHANLGHKKKPRGSWIELWKAPGNCNETWGSRSTQRWELPNRRLGLSLPNRERSAGLERVVPAIMAKMVHHKNHVLTISRVCCSGNRRVIVAPSAQRIPALRAIQSPMLRGHGKPSSICKITIMPTIPNPIPTSWSGVIFSLSHRRPNKAPQIGVR